MEKRLHKAWAPVAIVAAGALFFYLLARSSPDEAMTARARVAPSLPGAARVDPGREANEAGSAALESSRVAVPAELPGSLQGTDVPGGFRVGPDGHLQPTPDALALFDYYLAASGEEPPAMLRARIVDAIDARLEGVAAAEAVALLDDYLALREELRALAAGGEPPHDLERRLQWIRELRRAHFGAETADALFGPQERMLAVDLERRRIHLDDSLDEATRAARLAALEADLPENVRAARARSRAPTRTQEQVEALREAGASEAEVFAVRAEQFGPEAAERLAELDAQQAAWNARLEAFRDERAAIEANAAGLSDAEIETEVEALLETHFDGDELRRVRAIEGLSPALPELSRR